MNRDQFRRYALMPLLGIIFLGPGGCNSRPKPSDEPTGRFFVYVSVGNANKITVFQMAPATGALAALAGHPLRDPRVQVLMEDVGLTLRDGTERFDAILLDVDNGPSAFTSDENQELYDNDGVAAAHASLKTGGALAVWSAAEDQTYERRLRSHGFEVSARRVRAQPNKGGARHTIFLGLKP